MIERGSRAVGRIDLATAGWQRNEYGVDVLILSADPVSGAVTLALRTPAGLRYPEKEHYYDCDQDLFQFAGEFHHDEELSFRQGDYVWRPAGTVYGRSEGSDGGIILASLGRKPARHHYDEYPGSWPGHHRIDRLWHVRPDPFVVRAGEKPWQPADLHVGIEVQLLRGQPGIRSDNAGASVHSPWGAEAAFLLRLPAGHAGDFPAWPGIVIEALVVDGRARLGEVDWYRGCYGFDSLRGACHVSAALTLYCRSFRRLP
ncbi:MAG: hypothetical protein ABIX37_04050 [Gammaproteobacteria bacterium]